MRYASPKYRLELESVACAVFFVVGLPFVVLIIVKAHYQRLTVIYIVIFASDPIVFLLFCIWSIALKLITAVILYHDISFQVRATE